MWKEWAQEVAVTWPGAMSRRQMGHGNAAGGVALVVAAAVAVEIAATTVGVAIAMVVVLVDMVVVAASTGA